jgi:ABC-2 type transport system permease protein
LSYVVLAQILAPQLIVDTGILYSVWDGRVASRLLRPLSPFGDYLSEMLGGWVLRMLTFSLPAVGVALLLGVHLGPAQGSRAAWSLLSITLTVAVGAAVDFLFALAVVRASENMWAFRYARDSLVPLASGLIIPLGLMPWGIGKVLAWLPFASMASVPLRIYTGQGQPEALIALQAVWALALWSVTRIAWRRAAAKMVSFGG